MPDTSSPHGLSEPVAEANTYRVLAAQVRRAVFTQALADGGVEAVADMLEAVLNRDQLSMLKLHVLNRQW